MNRHNIPEPVEREIRERDTVCVYCHAPFGKTRKTQATFERLDDEAVTHPMASNVTLCCGSCNASRGPKMLAEWFASPYCTERNINARTVAPIVHAQLRRGEVNYD